MLNLTIFFVIITQFLVALTIWKILQTLKAMNVTIGHLLRAAVYRRG